MQIAYAVTQDLLKSRDELVKRDYLMQKIPEKKWMKEKITLN